ncbi:hypothetical protein LTR09_005191 [Extremus antarcticus]|uniref:Uncharacterized protein n=1 Tax=Extremus antarcticus TaxID=702011 RepID=A0AAJ0DNL8_9PEZI|nr:hypothetical protein LTR09_005191 [Extremus antarcticus]
MVTSSDAKTRPGFRTTRERLGKAMRHLEISMDFKRVVGNVRDIDDVVATLNLTTSASLIDMPTVRLYHTSETRSSECLRPAEQYEREAKSRNIDLAAQTASAKE